jgi:hypothetical protein
MKFPFSMLQDFDFISILPLWPEIRCQRYLNSNNLIIFNRLSIKILFFINLQLLGCKNYIQQIVGRQLKSRLNSTITKH